MSLLDVLVDRALARTPRIEPLLRAVPFTDIPSNPETEAVQPNIESPRVSVARTLPVAGMTPATEPVTRSPSKDSRTDAPESSRAWQARPSLFATAPSTSPAQETPKPFVPFTEVERTFVVEQHSAPLVRAMNTDTIRERIEHTREIQTQTEVIVRSERIATPLLPPEREHAPAPSHAVSEPSTALSRLAPPARASIPPVPHFALQTNPVRKAEPVDARHRHESSTPVVNTQVSIGRIIVTAQSPRASSPPRVAETKPMMSLQDYLADRERADR